MRERWRGSATSYQGLGLPEEVEDESILGRVHVGLHPLLSDALGEVAPQSVSKVTLAYDIRPAKKLAGRSRCRHRGAIRRCS